MTMCIVISNQDCNSSHIWVMPIYHRAVIYYKQQKLENATSGALSALEIFQKLGALEHQNRCKDFLQEIGRRVTSSEPGSSGELPHAIQYLTPINSSF